MNLLLSLNKKYVLFFSIILFVLFSFFYLFKYYNSFENQSVKTFLKVSNIDITEPRFAINSPNQKIYVSAEEGNFVDKDTILLKKNVKFKSEDFSILSDNVIFDRKNQTAESNDKSFFVSDKTTISSEGFDIYDNGNKINFHGNAVIILK